MTWTWISPALSLAVGLLTLGMTWGMLKVAVDHLKDEVSRLRATTERHEGAFSSLREELHVAIARSEGGKALTARRRRAS